MIQKTEVEYDFTVTSKPTPTVGNWSGTGVIHYADADLTFSFVFQGPGEARPGGTIFNVQDGGDPRINERVKDDLRRMLFRDFNEAYERALRVLRDDMLDGGNGFVAAP